MKIELSADHKYTIDGRPVPGVTEILRAGVVGEFIKHVDPVVLAEAQERGTVVHQITAMYDRGTLDEGKLDPLGLAYLAQWKLARRDLRLITPLEIEKMVYHKYGYAGTLDRVFNTDNGRVLVDIKTGGIEGADLQTAAYQRAYEDGDGGRSIRERVAVIITPDSCRRIEFKDHSDFNTFLSFKNVWEYNNRR